MHERGSRSPGRLSGIVRAAMLEVARTDPPAAPVSPTPTPTPAAVAQPAAPPPSAEVVDAQAKDAQAMRDLLKVLATRVQELQRHRQRSMEEIARVSVELGVALAERLMASEIAANRQRLDRIVAQAMERVPAGRGVTVHGHPADIALLKKQLAERDDMQACRENLTLQHDDSAARGQVTLEAGDFFVAWDTARCLGEMRGALLEANFTDAT